MKYKVGDKIMIMDKYRGFYSQHIGKMVTLNRKYDSNKWWWVDENKYVWAEKWFRKVSCVNSNIVFKKER